MKKFNWKELVLRVPIKVPALRVHTAWTSQEALESWFLRSAVFTTPDGKKRARGETVGAGDKFTWHWHGHGDEIADHNEMLHNNGKDHLQFSFADRCTVNVTVREENGETICELKQKMTMDEEDLQQYFYIDCGKGWTFYLANLKSVLEGGHDLRNKNIAIKQVVNA